MTVSSRTPRTGRSMHMRQLAFWLVLTAAPRTALANDADAPSVSARPIAAPTPTPTPTTPAATPPLEPAPAAERALTDSERMDARRAGWRFDAMLGSALTGPRSFDLVLGARGGYGILAHRGLVFVPGAQFTFSQSGGQHTLVASAKLVFAPLSRFSAYVEGGFGAGVFWPEQRFAAVPHLGGGLLVHADPAFGVGLGVVRQVPIQLGRDLTALVVVLAL